MPSYRFEIASTNRAGCQNAACKRDGVKILKGELRFGSLVEFEGHSSWKWKHWGCVTPKQIFNVVEQLNGLDGLDLDKDLDILDGYDEVTPEAQEKIKQALIDGHVADEDWKGDPELNRPGQKGINKRTPKKKKPGEEDDHDVEATPTKPKVKRERKVKVKAEDEDVDDDAPAPPKKKAAPRKRKATDELPEDHEAAAEKLTKKSRAKKIGVKAEDSDEGLMEQEKPKKRSRAKRVKTEVQEKAEAEEALPKKRPARSKKVKEESPDVLAAPELEAKQEPDADITMVENAKHVTKAKGRAKKVKAEEEEINPVGHSDGAEEDAAKENKKGGKKASGAGKGKKGKAK